MLYILAKNRIYVYYNQSSKENCVKVSAIGYNTPKVSFNGYAPAKDNHGYKLYEFNFPFDDEKYNCYLEVYNVEKDKHGNYSITDIVPNFQTGKNQLKLINGKNVVDLSSNYFISDDTPFAYHYKLVGINGGYPSYYVDSGNIIDERSKEPHEIYNLITQKGSNLTHGGSMKLIIPDNFNPGYVYNSELFTKNDIKKDDKVLEKAQKSYKHFSNKIGGTLAGVEKALDDGEFDGYSSIISLPVFTDDSVSSHAYWNKNNFQMAQSLGNINNFASIQRKLFAKGMTFVSDGAFVNEGLEGVHFANILKWGENSPFYNWFNISGFPLNLGVFGKNQKNISHKILNSPYEYVQKPDGKIKISTNRDYDVHKPTYVQIFDKRLLSEEQKNDKKNPIQSYDVLNTDNPYEINTHNDTVIPFKFEVDPKVYHKNMLNLIEYNKNKKSPIRIDDIEGIRFLNKYVNFELEDKIESNVETWDANTDILKLNFVNSHEVTEKLKNLPLDERAARLKLLRENNNQVQDYVISSGMFWTQKTKDILTLYTAQSLKNIEDDDAGEILNKINENIEDKIFPAKIKDLNENVIDNVINGDYVSDRKFYPDSYKDQVKMGLMNLPLESIEFGDNIAGVFATPYIAKRAIHEDEIGVSKYDLYKKGNPQLKKEYKRGYLYTQKMYDKEMSDFALDILSKVQKELPDRQKFSSGSDTTLYGKYVLPLLTSEIAKFAVIKSLVPDVKVYSDKETGEIGYDYKALKNVSLQELEIYGASPEDEAMSLISKIRSGVAKISEKDKQFLTDALVRSIKGTSVRSFALADLIIDKAEAGLDWRIDAAKDIANIDSMRNKSTDFDYTWSHVTKFWEKFNDSILKINPNSYIVAELTDEYDLHKIGNGDSSHKYKTAKDVRQKLIDETGLTALANYTYYFNNIIMMFGKTFEYTTNRASVWENDLPAHIFNNMVYQRLVDDKNNGQTYMSASNLPSLLYSYTFVGNHDKPRVLHGLALDMGMFYTDLTNPANHEYRVRAFKLLKDRYGNENPPSDDEIREYDFSRVSPKAVAMGEAVRTALIQSLDELSKSNDVFSNNHKAIFKFISQAVTALANGEYLGENFEADAFGVKPFEVTLDAVIKQGLYQEDCKVEASKSEKKANVNTKIYTKIPLTESDYDLLKNLAFKKMVEPAFSKLTGMMKYLVALPGKPTLYAGDDLASTGFESKTKNIYLQNRAYIHNEWLSDKNKEFVKKYHDELNKIMALRSRPELDALNNGTPILLPLQDVSDGQYNSKASAILRQNTDGKMAISIFNTRGINHNHDSGYKPEKVYVTAGKIVLSDPNDGERLVGITSGLKPNTKFVNAADENDVYQVNKDGDRYVLVHSDGSPICINDSTMILYHVPEKYEVAFTGKVAYKPSVNDVTKAYASAV